LHVEAKHVEAKHVEAKKAPANKPVVLPACESTRCPFTSACRHASGRVLKGDEFCFPAF
jgi:hypothetical protein